MKRIGTALFYYFVMLVSLALTLSACGQAAPPAPNPVQPAEPALTPEASVPSTGGAGPQVVVSDQTFDGTNVLVTKVMSQGPGWMTIHNQQDGHLGEVIGYTHVNDGENDNVIVKVDPKQITPVMYGMLHTDAGAVGKYEFPGADVPVMVDGQMIAPAFKANVGQTSGTLPAVKVHDQAITGSRVIIDQVVSGGPGWIAVHAQNKDGTPGNEIGYAAVKQGVNTNVAVTVDASKATPVLIAMLHTDAGDVGTYEYPGPDTPVVVNGQMVAPTFSSTGAAASGPTPTTAATAVAMDMGGTPMGTPAPTSAPASPNSPAPATASPDVGMVMATPANGVNPNVRISDQTVQNGMVKVDDVVSNGPGWIVIYTVVNGQPDEPIGHTAVHAGDNKDVMVQIDQAKAKDTLFAQLHLDAGQVGKFEFPGPDAPLMLGVKMIAGQFKNLSAVASKPPTQAASVPAITVQDQAIHDGMIVVPRVVSVGEAWLAIHPQRPDGTTGDYIGYAPVHDGVNENVLVRVDTRRTTSILFAMLHVNASKAASPQFPGADQPVMVGGQMLLPPFRVTGPLNGDVPITAAQAGTGPAHLADSWGLSLYTSLNDAPGKSNCTGDCLNRFRPLLALGSIKPGDGVAIGKIGVIALPNGTRQVTYSGLPLYYFADDKKPGDTLGHGVDGVWFLATP